MGVLAVGTSSYAGYLYRDTLAQAWETSKAYGIAAAEISVEAGQAKYDEARERVAATVEDKKNLARTKYQDARTAIDKTIEGIKLSATDTVNRSFGGLIGFFDGITMKNSERDAWAHDYRRAQIINAAYDGAIPPSPRTLSDIKRRSESEQYAQYNANIEPAVGAPEYTPETDTLSAEAVLVPRQVTVISSSQDGRIADIFVNHGDTFKKGDLLIAYDCTGIEAEAEIARIQKDLTKKKAEGTNKLFKLDIISDLDRLGAEVEDRQADAKARAYAAKMDDCQIRARFDGRVTNRLANPGEYTRTDRVLLEVASNEPLRAEFLVPSKWLRWVNVGAPVNITIGETEKTYSAHITNIHGEVDPVSQSIQMVATLDEYHDPLLPGMSGQVGLSVNAIRNAGIHGYLEAGYASQP
jgi:RND family efflux transporter MFP subunit